MYRDRLEKVAAGKGLAALSKMMKRPGAMAAARGTKKLPSAKIGPQARGILRQDAAKRMAQSRGAGFMSGLRSTTGRV